VTSYERFPTGLNIGLGSLTVVAASVLAAAVPTSDATSRLALVAAAVTVVAALSRDLIAAPVVAVLAWLIVNGFLIDRFGELSWHGRSDVYRAVILVLAAGIGQVAGQLWWRWHATREHRRKSEANNRV
jgi:hypothetical protein